MHEKIKVRKILSKISDNYRIEFFEKQEILGDENLNAQLTLWCEKLESNEYKQAKDQMYDTYNDSYCCLGVAGISCEINKKLMNGIGYPSDVLEHSNEPLWHFLSDEDFVRPFARLNDGDGLTFDEIATLIRYKYNL